MGCLCEDFFNLAKQIQKELGIADSALFGNRFKITHEAWSREKKANKVMHVNGREDLLDYPATGGDLTKLKTQRELEDLRTEFNFLSGPYNNHHISPKWMSKRLGIPEAEWDNCPGLIMPKNPREAYFNPTEYQEKWQEAPIYHAGTFAEGSLKERLKLIRNQFPGPALSVAQRQQMLIHVKQFYSSPPYDRLKLWPPTRDWLKIHIDPTLLPIE